MKAEVVEGWPKDNKIRIVLSDTNAAQVNSLRRAILADVPKMAITKVRFEQGVTQDNKGEVIESVNVLPDEVLAHRLAMVPVPTFLEEFVFPEDDPNNENLPEDQWGSPLSQIIYHLSIRGPNSDSADEVKTVYGRLECTWRNQVANQGRAQQNSIDNLVKGTVFGTLCLQPRSRRDHAKWCPAAAVTFQPRQKACTC